MSERDAHDPQSVLPTSSATDTPRAGFQLTTDLEAPVTPAPASDLRAVGPLEEAAAASDPGDTLLSVGKPAGRLELLLDDHVQEFGARFAALEDQIQELDSRLAMLEHKKSIAAPELRQRPWLWIAFLLALIIAFQLLHRVR